MAITIDIIGVDRASGAIQTVERAVNRLTRRVNRADGQLDQFGTQFLRGIANIGRDIEQVGRAIEGAGIGIRNFGLALTAATTLPFIAGLQASVDAAIEFESAFTGVIKTVDGLVRDGTINELNEQGLALRQGLIDLSRELPTTATELARIGELAGQLGVGAQDIEVFTRVIAEFVESTDVGLDDAAKALAQIANVFSDQVSDEFGGSIAAFADATTNSIVDLGNNFATTEREILQFFQTFAGNARGANISVQDTLAISTAFRSVRATSAASSTALQRFFQQLQTSANGSVSQLQPFLNVVNAIGTDAEGAFTVTINQLRQLAAEDPGEALFVFLRGLREFGTEIPNVLTELGLGDRRLIRELNKAAGGVDVLRDALDRSTAAFGEFGDQGARAEEAARRFATVESQFQLLRNDITALAIAIGDRLLPVISDVIEAFRSTTGDVIEFFEGLSDGAFTAILGLGALLASIGPIIAVIGLFISAGGRLIQTVGLITSGLASLSANLSTLAARFAATQAPISASAANIEVWRAASARAGASSLAWAGGLGILAVAAVAVVAGLVAMNNAASRIGDELNANVDAAIASSQAFSQLSNDLGDNADASFQQQRAIALSVNSYEEYIGALNAAGASTSALSEEQFNAIGNFDNLAEATDVAAQALDAYASGLEDVSRFESISLNFFGQDELNEGQINTIRSLVDETQRFARGSDEAAASVAEYRSQLEQLNQANVDAGLENIFGSLDNIRVDTAGVEELRAVTEEILQRGGDYQDVLDTVEAITGDERSAARALRQAFAEELGISETFDFSGFRSTEDNLNDAITGIVALGDSLVETQTDVDEFTNTIATITNAVGQLDIGEIAFLVQISDQTQFTDEALANLLTTIRDVDLTNLTIGDLGLSEAEAIDLGLNITDEGEFTNAQAAADGLLAALLNLSDGSQISESSLIALIDSLPNLSFELDEAATTAQLVSEAIGALGNAVGETFAGALQGAIDGSVALVDAQQSLNEALSTGDPDAIIAAYEELEGAQLNLLNSSNQLALELSRIELVQGDEGFETQIRDIDEAYINLARSLGTYTDAQADAAIETIRTRNALEEVATAANFLGISQEAAAAAGILIRDGLAETSEEAIGLVANNNDLVDATLAYNRSLVEQETQFAESVSAAQAFAESIVAITEAQNAALASSVAAGQSLAESIFGDEEIGGQITGLDSLFTLDFGEAEDAAQGFRDDAIALIQQTAFDIATAGSELTSAEEIQLQLEFGLITPEQAQFQTDLLNVQNTLRAAFGTILIDDVPVNFSTILGEFDESQFTTDVLAATQEAGRGLEGVLALVASVALELNLSEEDAQAFTDFALDNAAQGQSDLDSVQSAIVQTIDVSTDINFVDAGTDVGGPGLTGPDQTVAVNVTTEGVEQTVADLATIASEADTVVGEEARQILFESNLDEVQAETMEFDQLASIISATEYTVSFNGVSITDAITAVQNLEAEVQDLSATITYQVIVNGEENIPSGGGGVSNPAPGTNPSNFFSGGMVKGTSGIDRISALLSKGEFVMPRSAMRKAGVPKMMEMLRGGLTPEQAAGRMNLLPSASSISREISSVSASSRAVSSSVLRELSSLASITNNSSTAIPTIINGLIEAPAIPVPSFEMPGLPPSAIAPIEVSGGTTIIDNSTTEIDRSRKAEINIGGRRSRGREASVVAQTFGRL